MPLSTPDTGILIINTFPAELGTCLGASEKSLISKLGSEFHIRAISALGKLDQAIPEQGIILNGSPYSLLDEHSWTENYKNFVREMIKQRKTILGICFGHQGLADIHGGKIENLDNPKFGAQEVNLTDFGIKHPLFHDLPEKIMLPGSHFNHVINLPEKHKVLAHTDASPNYAIDISTETGANAWGIQFHPEMDSERLAAIIEIKKDGIPDWKIKKSSAKKSDFGDFGNKIISNYGRAVLGAKQR